MNATGGWRAALVAVLVAMAPCHAASGAAQQVVATGPIGEPPPAERSRGPADAAEIGAFLDGLMAAHLADHRIAGAAVAIVRDGELLFSRGYGWADVDRRIPVDPSTTLFRIGSVTKLFTWTAVMQLRDAGLLDLDAAVDDYLDFSIPATFPEPITLRHLLTHTGGFEDRAFGLFAPPPHAARGEWLRRHAPARVRPPGREIAYSNYGTALAGYIVERVSGMSWEDYVEARILEPLGMRHASARQPLPDGLAPFGSAGYVYRDGRFVAQSFDWINGPLAPAGSISASAEAMAAFMIAHLRDGRRPGPRILAASTVREMQARAFGHDPRINGFALGFYEKSSHALRIVGHDGGTQRFFTDLALIPSEGVGIFVAYNSVGGGMLAGRAFLSAFLDHYYPVTRGPVPEPIPGWESRAPRFEGRYLPLRRAYTTWEKPFRVLAPFRVEAVAPGEIVLRTPRWEARLHEAQPGYFRTEDGSFAAAFLERPGGELHLSLGGMAGMPLEKVRASEDPRLHALLLLATLLVLGSGMVFAPVRFGLQRTCAGVEPLRGWERGLRWAAMAFAMLAFGFLLALVTTIGGPDRFVTGEGLPGVRAALSLPVLAVPLAALLVVGAARGFRRRYWTRAARFHFALVALAAVVFLLLLHDWNLLGWRF